VNTSNVIGNTNMINKHACNCQFCDKEMLAENMATMVCGYITCGAHQCQIEAENVTTHFIREEISKVEHNARVLVFSTKTPEDDKTWRLVVQKDHPAAMKDVHVMGQMQAGHFMYLEDEKIYFCVKSPSEVLKDVTAGLADAS